MDDAAQGLIARRVAPDQFPFRELRGAWVLLEGPGSPLLSRGELVPDTVVDPVDNFGQLFPGGRRRQGCGWRVP